MHRTRTLTLGAVAIVFAVMPVMANAQNAHDAPRRSAETPIHTIIPTADTTHTSPTTHDTDTTHAYPTTDRYDHSTILPAHPPHPHGRLTTVCRWVPDYGYHNRHNDDWNWNHRYWSPTKRPHYHQVCRTVRI